MYIAKARLFPFFIVIFPLVLGAVALFPNIVTGWSFLGSLFGVFGLTMLFSELGRDLGKKKEGILFKQWGGRPSEAMLSHEKTNLDIHTLDRYHKKLSTLLSQTKLPTKEEEIRDQSRAFEIYTTCVSFLIGRTRDIKKYPLLFNENVSYGFRRNLWAMKAAAIIIAIIGIAICFGVFLAGIVNGNFVALPFVGVLVNVSLLVWWIFRITPDWVHIVSITYAKTLLSVLDSF